MEKPEIVLIADLTEFNPASERLALGYMNGQWLIWRVVDYVERTAEELLTELKGIVSKSDIDGDFVLAGQLTFDRRGDTVGFLLEGVEWARSWITPWGGLWSVGGTHWDLTNLDGLAGRELDLKTLEQSLAALHIVSGVVASAKPKTPQRALYDA